MRLTVFQKIGLVGIAVLVIGGVLTVVLPQASPPGAYTGGLLGVALFGVGALLTVVGIVGGFVLALGQIGSDRTR